MEHTHQDPRGTHCSCAAEVSQDRQAQWTRAATAAAGSRRTGTEALALLRLTGMALSARGFNNEQAHRILTDWCSQPHRNLQQLVQAAVRARITRNMR